MRAYLRTEWHILRTLFTYNADWIRIEARDRELRQRAIGSRRKRFTQKDLARYRAR